jgi:CBS domain-containing protein
MDRQQSMDQRSNVTKQEIAMSTCYDLMTTDPVTCTVRSTATEAAQLMKSHDLGWLPIVDNSETRTLLGVVTDRDLALKVIAEGLDPGRTPIEDVMTLNPVACGSYDDVDAALDAMAQQQVRRIPVVDEGRLVGVIAQADIARHLGDPERTADVLRKISQPTITHPSMAIRKS